MMIDNATVIIIKIYIYLFSVMICLIQAGCGTELNVVPQTLQGSRQHETSNVSIVTQTLLTGSDFRAVAGPLGTPQCMDDLTGGIQPWGPVQAIHEVTIDGQSYTVNQLASPDPFTATYQLEDGAIVVTNEPLADVIQYDGAEPVPPIIPWTGPDGVEIPIAQGEIVVTFVQGATEQQIAQFIITHNLHVIMSWFEPLDTGGTTLPAQQDETRTTSEIGGVGLGGTGLPGASESTASTSGNEIAWFEFEYDQAEFATFDAAYAFFDTEPLIEIAVPNFATPLHNDYTPPVGAPNDTLYTYNRDLWINRLDIDTSMFIPTWPHSGVRQVVVLGVTGLYCLSEGNYSAYNPGSNSSNWYYDNTYPISGIYSFSEGYSYGRSTCTPFLNGSQVDYFESFSGTSAAAPQVSALAYHLYSLRNEVNYLEVRQQIIGTRDVTTEQYGARPMAGVLDFDKAITTWWN